MLAQITFGLTAGPDPLSTYALTFPNAYMFTNPA